MTFSDLTLTSPPPPPSGVLGSLRKLLSAQSRLLFLRLHHRPRSGRCGQSDGQHHLQTAAVHPEGNATWKRRSNAVFFCPIITSISDDVIASSGSEVVSERLQSGLLHDRVSAGGEGGDGGGAGGQTGRAGRPLAAQSARVGAGGAGLPRRAAAEPERGRRRAQVGGR